MGTLIGIGFGSYTGGGGVPSTLDFYSPLTSSLTLTTGTASSTFTRATTATCIDSGGLVTPCASGEARFEGSTHNGTNDWTAHANSKGILIEEARTNIIQESETMTTWWSANGTPTQVLTAIGVDGAAGAMTLTDNDGAAFEFYYASGISVSANTNTHIATIYYAKTTSASSFPGVSLQVLGTTERQDTTINTDTGVLSNRDGVTSTGSATSQSIGNFWKVSIYVTNDGIGIALRLDMMIAVSTTGSGAWLSTITGSATWDAIQLELNADFPTSYIPSTGGTTARNADVLTYDYQPSATTGSMVMTTTPLVAANDAVALGHNTSCLYMTGTPRESNDGTNQVVFGNPTVNTETNYGLTWEDAGTPETATYKDGSQINTGALDAGFDPSTNELGIGCQGSTGTLQQSGTYKEIKIYTDAKDQAFMEAAT